MRRRERTEQSERAAMLMAEGQSERRIAETLGVSRNTVASWRQEAGFQQSVKNYTEEIRKRIVTAGAAVKANRIRAKRNLLRAIYRGLGARAGNPKRGGAGWDHSGLFVRTEKSIQTGPSERKVLIEYALDNGTVHTILSIHEAIAIEVGDWKKPSDEPEKPDASKLDEETIKALSLFTAEEIAIYIERRRAAAKKQSA